MLCRLFRQRSTAALLQLRRSAWGGAGDGVSSLPPRGSFPPHRSSFAPPRNNFPPARGNFSPPRDSFPPQRGNFPPPRDRFPPQRGGFPPPRDSFPPQRGGFAPQRGGFPQPRGGFPPPGGRGRRGGGGGGGPFPFRPVPVKGKSEWWAMDGEMHEIGEGVPHRERFVIPRDNLPNKRRKRMREQFMIRTRLVLRDNEHELWCKKYMELYQELRENWERLYWDEGYSKKIAQDHTNYDSAEDDDLDFSPYRRRRSFVDQIKDQGFVENKQGDNRMERVNQIRDKFEYDRERRMREKAFAPMNMGNNMGERNSNFPKNQPFDAGLFFPQSFRN